MMPVTAHSVADQLCINLRPALAGMLVFFKHEVELPGLLIKLEILRVGVVERRRILLLRRLQHIHTSGVARNHVALPVGQRLLFAAHGR